MPDNQLPTQAIYRWQLKTKYYFNYFNFEVNINEWFEIYLRIIEFIKLNSANSANPANIWRF